MSGHGKLHKSCSALRKLIDGGKRHDHVYVARTSGSVQRKHQQSRHIIDVKKHEFYCLAGKHKVSNPQGESGICLVVDGHVQRA